MCSRQNSKNRDLHSSKFDRLIMADISNAHVGEIYA